MLESKLASTEWEDMVKWARMRIGLPPRGLDPEQAQEFLLGAMMNLLLPSMLVHPRLGPEMMEQFENQASELLIEVSDDELERGVGLLLSASPSVLLKLRFAAAHLASWLGVDEENIVMTYLVSPKRWPLNNASPKKRAKSGKVQVPTVAGIICSLLPIPSSQRAMKGILLRGFVKGARTILPKMHEDQAGWEDVREIWNALFPEWRYEHWRNIKKAHDYSLRQRVAEGN